MSRPNGEQGFLLAELSIFLLLLSLLLLFLFSLGLTAQRLQAQSAQDFGDQEAQWSALRLISGAVHSAQDLSVGNQGLLSLNEGGSVGSVTIFVKGSQLVEEDSYSRVLASVNRVGAVSFAQSSPPSGGTYVLATVSPPSSNLNTPAPLSEGFTLWLSQPEGGQGAGAPTITTTSLPDGMAGTSYSATLAATGGSPPYTWTATGLPTWLTLSPSGVLSGTPTAAGTSAFTITVTDSANYSASHSFSLTVNPVLSITTTRLPDGMVWATYSTTLAATGGTGSYTWTATDLPTWLTLNPSGVLSGTPPASGPFTVNVTVTDSANYSARHSFSLTVNPTLWILSQTLPDGMVETPYSAALTASGGSGSYTWTATGLPTWLTLNPSGVLSGKPTASGTLTFTITVTDSDNYSTSQSFSLTVNPALSITTSSLPTGMVGSWHSTTMQARGGSGSYTWTATGLPTWLTLSPSGVLSGTPTAAGTSTFTITVTDSANHSTSQSFSLTVLAITPTSLPTGMVGSEYFTTTLQATGGTSPYTWSATGLPDGLDLTSGGVLSGKPTASGKFTVIVTVKDSANHSSSKSFSLTIYSTLTITTTDLLDATKDTLYSFPLQATGGSSSYTWSATDLPDSLTISPDGVISGTPTKTQNYNVTITVSDSADNTNSKAFHLHVKEHQGDKG